MRYVIRNLRSGESTSSGNINFIVDDTGRLVTFPDQREDGDSELLVPGAADDWQDRYRQLIQESGLTKGNDIAIHSTHDELLGWNFINVSDQSEVLQEIESQRNLMLLVIFFVSLFVIAMIILVTHHMTGSIARIVRGMKKAGEGDLEVRVPPAKNMPSELETITKQFNKMMGTDE